MKHLFRIVLSVAVVAAMAWSCKKTQPEPKKDTTFVLEAAVSGEAKYDGSGDVSYTVKSIRKIDNKEEFMPWSMEFSTDGGSTWSSSKPDFITLTTQENNGDLTAKSYTAKFTAQKKTIGNNSADILKAREKKNNVDLSMVDVKGNTLAGGQSTANCYVIHNPGTYQFPTVYGNSIKNGADNKSAYTSSKQGQSNILSPFINAYGQGITKPQIDNIANACLIWQDTKDLISNISYNANYVSFEVKKETIHNGNAIIAVRDASNTILWSWHIWVTEEDLTPVEITNHNNINYSILPVNLGWCGLGTATDYAQREIKVKIKQRDSNKIVELVLNQKGHSEGDRKGGNCTFYQWGRKDPMLPGNGIGDTDKSCYTTDDRYQFAYQDHGEPLNTTDIKEYIRNPHKFNIKWEMDGKYYNLWSTDNARTDGNDEVVIKSVYDPSPVGYSLPASNAFTGFTTTGSYTRNPAEYNVNGDFNKGWYFYTKKNKKGSTVFFPAWGYRYYDTGSLYDVSTNGYCWVAGPDNRSGGRCLGFHSDGIGPLDDAGRSYGFTVRPAQEK
ncbi:MAG: fimbrillin family protein [Candidatus Cryptobacteroides sp.]